MSRLIKSASTALILAPAWIAMPAQTLFSADFSTGSLPAEISVANETGVYPASDAYKNGYTRNGWMVAQVNRNGYAAVSPTYNGEGKEVRNILSLPALTITEGCWLRWRACSVYPDFPDSYSVTVTETSTGETATITGIEMESSRWATRLADLSDFAGKEVTVSFKCDSKNGYLLALDDIYVGNLNVTSVISKNNTPRYFGADGLTSQEEAEISMTLTNTGMPLEGAHLRWTDAEGNTIYGDDLPSVWPSASVINVKATAPATLQQKSTVTLSIINADGNELEAGKAEYFVSDFARRHIVDEATGMWCNNCPDGTRLIESLTDEFGESMIPLVTHQNDVLENADYWDRLKFYALPYFKLDRIQGTSFRDDRYFSNYYDLPVRFGLRTAGLETSGDGVLTATVTIEASPDIENSDDRYRLGYVVTADFMNGEKFYQSNNATSPSAGAYFFLPSTIGSGLVRFHNVTLTSEYAFSGMEGSIPANIGDGSAAFTFSIDRPELLTEWEGAHLNAYVIDTTTGQIENATSWRIGDPISGVEDIPVKEINGKTPSIASDHRGTVSISVPGGGDYVLEAFTPAGVNIMTLKGFTPDSTPVLISTDSPTGITIFKVSTAEGHATVKASVK